MRASTVCLILAFGLASADAARSLLHRLRRIDSLKEKQLLKAQSQSSGVDKSAKDTSSTSSSTSDNEESSANHDLISMQPTSESASHDDKVLAENSTSSTSSESTESVAPAKSEDADDGRVLIETEDSDSDGSDGSALQFNKNNAPYYSSTDNLYELDRKDNQDGPFQYKK